MSLPNESPLTAPTPTTAATLTAEGPYPIAARVIWLHLKEFCDEGMTVPDMIAEASRRANREIESLRAALLAARRENETASQALRKYGRHLPDCRIGSRAGYQPQAAYGAPCSCGLGAALAATQEGK